MLVYSKYWFLSYTGVYDVYVYYMYTYKRGSTKRSEVSTVIEHADV